MCTSITYTIDVIAISYDEDGVGEEDSECCHPYKLLCDMQA